jgi:hypothetical protein
MNSEPENEQEGKIISLLRDYKEKSTSGLPEARNVIKAHIKNCILTGFDIYSENESGGLEDICLFEETRIDESNRLADYILPFGEPQSLTAREKFEIILYMNGTVERNGRDGAFKSLLSKYECYGRKRTEGCYESMRYEYNDEDISNIYTDASYSFTFADKIEIITQRLYEEIFGLKHIDMLAYSDINEVGFSNNGKYVYCWCGKKIWLSFLYINENEARVIQDSNKL